MVKKGAETGYLDSGFRSVSPCFQKGVHRSLCLVRSGEVGLVYSFPRIGEGTWPDCTSSVVSRRRSGISPWHHECPTSGIIVSSALSLKSSSLSLHYPCSPPPVPSPSTDDVPPSL